MNADIIDLASRRTEIVAYYDTDTNQVYISVIDPRTNKGTALLFGLDQAVLAEGDTVSGVNIGSVPSEPFPLIKPDLFNRCVVEAREKQKMRQNASPALPANLFVTPTGSFYNFG